MVMQSYVLGEIPSLKDRITVARQLWDLTRDVLVWSSWLKEIFQTLICLSEQIVVFGIGLRWTRNSSWIQYYKPNAISYIMDGEKGKTVYPFQFVCLKF